MAYGPSSDDVPGRSNAAIDMGAGLSLEITSAPSDSAKAAALVYEHPDYCANVEKWKKYQRLYNSRDVYQYVYQHTREDAEMFSKRVKRGYYLNYVSAIVDLYVAYLYHSPLTRQPSHPEIFEELYKNADRRGTTYQTFIQEATTQAQIGGFCGVLVDMPVLPEGGFQTQADQEAAQHRPHLVIVKNSQILDWELDRDGHFEWVKIEVTRPQERSWDAPFDETTRHFQIWSKTDWQEWKVTVKDGEEKPKTAQRVGGAPHNLEQVPLVILRNEVDLEHSWFGISAVRDIADLNIAILNWCSLMDEEVYERCLNILTVQSTGGPSSEPVKLSHNNVLEYSGENAPAYLIPGTTPIDLILKAVATIKDEIYRLAKLGGDTGLMKSRQATSGIAYAFEFNTTNQSLGKKAEAAQQAEIEIHRLVAKWMGQEFSGTITYPKEFGVEDFLQDLQLLADARTMLSSKTAIRELEKKTTAKMFARDPQDLRDTIAKEVDKSDPQDEDLLSTSLGLGPIPEPPPVAEGPSATKPTPKKAPIGTPKAVGGGPQKGL